MTISLNTLKILEPAPNVLAFYDGRISGVRMHSEAPNWFDDGAYSLGVASYVLIDGEDALVFDTSISVAHGRVIRDEITRRGVRRIRVLLSHFHHDHVAGTEAFSDCEIIASQKTTRALEEHHESYITGSPPISPLIMPTTVFEGETELTVGNIGVELRPLDIHSFDGLALYLPATRMLFAADTLEDTVTYVDEPDRLEIHLGELERLAGWDIAQILPNHGDPGRIGQGGYAPSLIAATQDYVQKLLNCRTNPELATLGLEEFVADHLESGALIYYDAYEEVHSRNVEAVLKASPSV